MRSQNKWAIVSAAWKRVSPPKKRKYTKLAMRRLRAQGKRPKIKAFVNRPPQEFYDRVILKRKFAGLAGLGAQPEPSVGGAIAGALLLVAGALVLAGLVEPRADAAP